MHPSQRFGCKHVGNHFKSIMLNQAQIINRLLSDAL